MMRYISKDHKLRARLVKALSRMDVAAEKGITVNEQIIPTDYLVDELDELNQDSWRTVHDAIDKIDAPGLSPWNDARIYAEKLERALIECGWRHGSCHSDFDERGRKWSALIDLMRQIIKELKQMHEEDRQKNKEMEVAND